jgi:ketosteroid isomerase-like protein
MTSAEPLDVVRRVLEVYSGDMAATFRDPDRLAIARETTDALFHPDVTLVLPAETEGTIAFPSGQLQGVEQLVSVWSEWFDVFESVVQDHTELESLEDGRIFVHTDTTIRISTGDEATFTAASIWEVEDGRVVWLAFGPSVQLVREAAGLEDEKPA